jgi:two-component system, cell cycle response regulator DivK
LGRATRVYQAIVIEDDRDLSFIFSEALRVAGFQVEVITDGGRALARLAEITPTPDLIVLDMYLPHVSGVNILRQIHADPHLIVARIMIVTADTLLAEEVRTKADAVIVKPIGFAQILEQAQKLVPGVLPPDQRFGPPE